MTKYYFTIKPDADEVGGFYNDADHQTIPEGAIETTKEEIDAACESQANTGKRICITANKIDLQSAPSLYHFWKNGEWETDLSAAINAAAYRISDGFNDAIASGHFLSTTLGIEVDCRRNLTKNDYQNVQGILSRMNREGIESVTYIGASESVTATRAQIQALLYEMEDHVAALYAKKWDLEAQIEAATTADELAQITW